MLYEYYNNNNPHFFQDYLYRLKRQTIRLRPLPFDEYYICLISTKRQRVQCVIYPSNHPFTAVYRLQRALKSWNPILEYCSISSLIVQNILSALLTYIYVLLYLYTSNEEYIIGITAERLTQRSTQNITLSNKRAFNLMIDSLSISMSVNTSHPNWVIVRFAKWRQYLYPNNRTSSVI